MTTSPEPHQNGKPFTKSSTGLCKLLASGKRSHRSLKLRSTLITSLLLAWFTCAPLAHAQENQSSFNIGGLDQDIYTLTEPVDELTEGGMGAWFQAGYIAGQSIDLNESVLHLEASPYMFVEEGMFFGSARFFRTNTGDWGGSGGLGYRHYFEGIDRMFGASIWYDRDASRGPYFEQVGLSLETLGENFDFRTNLYYPVGTEEKQLDLFLNPNSLRFREYNLLYDQTRVIGEALKGLDMELGLPIKQEIAERHNVRAYAGWYYFLSDNTDDVIGWKTRLEANPIPSVTMDLQLQDDEVFGTSVNFSVAWTFDPHNSFRSNWHRNTWDRMTTPVRRNRGVVVSEQSITERDIVAINPATGLPYIIRHVNSDAAPGGNGTFENPFDLIQDATTQGGNDTNYDIVYVHADSVFTGANASIITDPGKRMLGEGQGITHLISIPGFGNQALPRATNGILRPQLLNAAGPNGDAVTLREGSEFSGFIISSPLNHGVVIDNNDVGGIMRFVDINNAGGMGITMTDSDGTFTFETVNIANSTNSAFNVQGGAANVTYFSSVISNTGSDDPIVNIVDTTGGAINMRGTTISETGGGGINIQRTAGSVVIDSSTITDSDSTAINIDDIRPGSIVSFIGNTTIANANQTGFGSVINIHDIDDGSLVTFNNTTISQRNAGVTGIFLDSNNGDVTFFGATTLQSSGTDTVSDSVYAIDVQNSAPTADIQFNTVSIFGNNSDVFTSGGGIRIGGQPDDGEGDGDARNAGTFTVAGNVEINDMTGHAILIDNDGSNVTFDGVVDIDYLTENIGDQLLQAAIQINNHDADNFVLFRSALQMDGTDAVAINAVNNLGGVLFGNTTVESGAKENGVVRSINNSTVSFQSLSIDNTGDSLEVRNTGSFSIQSGGVINNEAGTAILVDNSVININLQQVTGTGDAGNDFINPLFEFDAGIAILDSSGSFVINGNSGQSSLVDYTLAGIYLEDYRDGNGDVIGDSVAANDNRLLEFDITDVLFEDNNVGLYARNIDEITLDTVNIVNSINEGVLAINTSTFTIGNSTTEDNGGIDDPVINLLYNTARIDQSGRPDSEFYRVFVLGNNLNNQGFSESINTILNIEAVRIINNEINPLLAAAGEDSLAVPSAFGIDSDDDDSLIMDMEVTIANGNNFTYENSLNIDDQAAININWNGGLDAVIGAGTTAATRNFFNLGTIDLTGDLVGINIANQTNQDDEDTDVTMTNNQFQINTNLGDTTVVNFDINEELDLLFVNNVMTTIAQDTDANVRGLVFDVGNDSDIQISNNTLQFAADDATAILFSNIQGPSRVQINGNILNFQSISLNGAIDRGVIFNTINGTIALSSPSDNEMNVLGFPGLIQYFNAPAGSTTGSISINGINYQ